MAFLLGDHDHHEAAFEALSERRLGLSGHAGFETFSVLTRLPPPSRRNPAAVARLLEANFPESRFLGDRRTAMLLRSLGGLSIGGGSVYDALVAAAAVEHELLLVTRDPRALSTYRRLGAEV